MRKITVKPGPVTLRRATALDAGATGEILHAFQAETPWMPDLYSSAETISFCGVMIDRGWVTVAARGRRVLGFSARDGAELCALYVAASARGLGVGAALLSAAKSATPRLRLRTFAANSRARAFYRRQGFVQTSQGDGSGNAEALPDIAYEWRAARGILREAAA
ncbi:GNAT family N-acetyltransferase [Cribrihabitans pelagius]|uniref:GNAT family N-acetyltransferase n=1 Tax=Cribrihabitans pelagius TaxID=1765746 RepID=UPI003B5A1721